MKQMVYAAGIIIMAALFQVMPYGSSISAQTVQNSQQGIESILKQTRMQWTLRASAPVPVPNRSKAAGKTLLVAQPLLDKASGKRILTIPYGAAVKLLKETDIPCRKEGMKGHWVQVAFNGNTGYIFDRYLTRLPAPPINCETLVQYADTYFKKKGKPIIKKFEANQDYDTYHVRTTQNYSGGIKIERDSRYESNSNNLVLKGVTLEEAFLIGRLCFSEEEKYLNKPLRTHPFEKNRGRVEIVIDSTDAWTLVFKVEALKNGWVRVSLSTGV